MHLRLADSEHAGNCKSAKKGLLLTSAASNLMSPRLLLPLLPLQLDELRARILRERAEVREEGARSRARAEEDAEEARRREEARRQQAVQANLATTAANDALLKWKEDMRQREKEEEKRNAGEDLGTLLWD